MVSHFKGNFIRKLMQSLGTKILFQNVSFAVDQMWSVARRNSTQTLNLAIYVPHYYPRNLKSSSIWFNNRASVKVCNPFATQLFVFPRIPHHYTLKRTSYIATPAVQVFLHGRLKQSSMLVWHFKRRDTFLDYFVVIMGCEQERFITEMTKVYIFIWDIDCTYCN